MIEKDAVDSIITALKEAGTVIGQPALEYTVVAVRIEGITLIVIAVITGILGFISGVYSKRYADIYYNAQEDFNVRMSGSKNAYGFMTVTLLVISLILSLISFLIVVTPNNWLRIFSPIGYIVKSYLNL